MIKATLLLYGFIFCLNTLASEFEVVSNPLECEVFVLGPQGEKNSLGKTPIKMDMGTLAKTYGQTGVLNLSVKKAGFDSYDVIVPAFLNSNVKINANLEVEKDTQLTQDYDLLTTDLFDVLRMMRVKDYKSAYTKLDLLERKFPHFSIVYEMKGAVLYLQHEYKMALNFYRKAFGINPKNREAYKMKVYLESKFGLSEDKKSEEGKN